MSGRRSDSRSSEELLYFFYIYIYRKRKFNNNIINELVGNRSSTIYLTRSGRKIHKDSVRLANLTIKTTTSDCMTNGGISCNFLIDFFIN